MVNVDLPWWQWHLNSSRLFSMRCCDLCKEIKMTAFFICTVTLFLLLLGGGDSYLGCDAFWECLYFCHTGLHIQAADRWNILL